MTYLIQLTIILIITFIGEVLHRFIPLPIPASVYGLAIMLICLVKKIIKIEQVRATGNFLVDIMPIMFIPAAVGLISIYNEIAHIVVPIILITLLTTVFVMVATGKMTDFILKKDDNNERGN